MKIRLFTMRHYIALFLSLFSLFSCVNQLDKEEETIEQGTIPINISTRVQSSKTRVTNTSFDVDDAIGLYVLVQPATLEETRYIDNTKFTYNSSQLFVNEESIFYPEGNKSCNFISYFPYTNEGVKKGTNKIDVSIEKDQSSPQAFSSSTFMVAKATNITATEETIDLLFKHKFTRLNIQINPGKYYDLNELLTANPTVRIKGINTKASYDFVTNKISEQDTPEDIIPYGSWSIVDNVLSGKSAIAIPQTLQAPHTIIELIIDGKVYECKIKDDFILSSGSAEDITIHLSASTQVVEVSINPSIEGWGEANPNEIDAEEVSGPSIHIPSLSFAKSNVYKVISQGKQVAEICKEYLCSDILNSQAIVIYPVQNGQTNLAKGLICQLINETKQVHGGEIEWNKNTNTFIYQEGNSSAIDYIYITDNNEISTTEISNPIQIYHLPDILTDTRGSETITYPIVKIGTQYWMRSNLKATKYADGTDITKGENFKTVVAKYCQPNAFYYFYNSAAIAHKPLAPQSWRIGNESDWEILNKYIDNNVSLIKGGTFWGEDKANNLTGFNGVATGLYNEVHTYQDANKNWFAFYWCTENSNPQLTLHSLYLSSHNNALNTGSNKDVLGACIRCIKE
ncbi:fimbrillin family protein [Bacteroides sp. 224]|uniref:fimbrillin family protein n=1 Tax=Bacteroides sp. 224 TaxID=2302936 RepID=UPI0013D71AB4|nr:fimbrillin family protein [Bacteroides sp. 224]NDV65934.1 hypothetical protein [Bacteroides sp. 224]